MSDIHDDHALSPERAEHESARPSEMRLRADRPSVTRLSRKVLVGLGGVAAIAIAGALFFALKSHPQTGGSELFNTSNRSTPEGLSDLPRDYSGLARVPKLGPPLPGDLGKPILNSGVSTPGMPTQGATPERQRLASRTRCRPNQPSFRHGRYGPKRYASYIRSNSSSGRASGHCRFRCPCRHRQNSRPQTGLPRRSDGSQNTDRGPHRGGAQPEYVASRRDHPRCVDYGTALRSSRRNHRPSDAGCLGTARLEGFS